MYGFTQLLDKTRKDDSGFGNWTRDRGCALHGPNNCAPMCFQLHPAPVPNAYKVVSVELNHNPELWQKYCQARDEVQKACSSSKAYKHQSVDSSKPPFNDLGIKLGRDALAKDCNEWYLFHGAPRAACESICKTNFSVQKAGGGATIKVHGKAKRPLYGWGVYFAERITKSDK